MFNRIKEILLRGNASVESSNSINQLILKEILNCFEQSLKRDSIGTQMIYPSSFIVLLHPNDYQDHRQQFLLVQRQIITYLYESIKKWRPMYPDYITLSKYWHLQFIPISEDTQVDGLDVEAIKEGEVAVIGRFYDEKPGEAQAAPSNALSQENYRVSLRNKKSEVYKTQSINLDFLKDVDIPQDCDFWIRFNPGLDNSSPPAQAKSMEYIAKLKYNSDTMNTIPFFMVNNEIEITGATDTRNQPNVFKIEKSGVMPSHARIRYSPVNKKFEICTYGDLRVNERRIEKSNVGEAIWSPLPLKANLLVGDQCVPVNFEANNQ